MEAALEVHREAKSGELDRSQPAGPIPKGKLQVRAVTA